MSSILTLKENKDSSDNVRLAFDRYFTKEISYPSNKVDAVVGFFRSRGFDEEAANSVGSVLFELLDSLKVLDKVKLSNLTTAILNANRSKISKLGYRNETVPNNIEARNIIY
jgi:NhaP-type Na+/H+ and K+/H+ antiporter